MILHMSHVFYRCHKDKANLTAIFTSILPRQEYLNTDYEGKQLRKHCLNK